MTELSEQDAQDIIRSFSESKQNLHSFLTNIIKSPDTIKTGNLEQDELGKSKLPVRTYKELELFSKDVAYQSDWADYFKSMAEIQTSTSLSKNAKLLDVAVTLKKEVADRTPTRKENKGWFKKKEDNSGEQI